MEERDFYLLSLWAPLVLPWLLFPVWLLVESAPSSVALVIGAVAISPLMAGVPYFVFALVAARWLRNRTAADGRWLMWRAPLFLVPVFSLYFLLLQLGIDLFSGFGIAWLGYGEALLYLLRYIFALGYAYVIGVALLVRWLSSSGRIRLESQIEQSAI